MNARDRLIAEVRKRRGAVTGKIYRIKRTTGVNIAGQKDDPRLDTKEPLKMSTSQLRSYYRRLDAFMSRDVGFIPIANGKVVSKSRWREYVQYQMRYNKIGAEHLKGIKSIFIPSAGMTIAEREATFTPDSLAAQGDVINRPYSNLNRKPENIASPESLEKLIAQLKRKVSKGFLPSEIKKSREQLNDMLEIIGDQSLTNKMNGLSDKQFDVLWNYTNFATNISLLYNIFKIKATSSSPASKERWLDSVAEDTVGELNELGDWAHSIRERGKKR